MGIVYSGTFPAPHVARAIMKFDPTNQMFIANRVAKPIMVPEMTGTLANVTIAGMMGKAENSKRAPGAARKRDDIKAGGTAYACENRSREVVIPREHYARYSNLFDAVSVGAKKAKGQLWVEREIAMAALLFNTTTWTGASLYTDVSSAPWDTAGSDVIGAVATAAEVVRANCGQKPNAIILGEKQRKNLVGKNTAIRALLSGIAVASPAAVNQFLADILDVKYVISGEAVYNAGNEADTSATVTDVWGDDYAMICRVAETEDESEPCVARTVAWEAMGVGTDMRVEYYEEPQTTSLVVQADTYEDQIVIDTSFGHLLKIDA